MYIYERKSNKVKATVTVGIAAMFLFVSALYIWRDNDDPVVPVAQTEVQNGRRLQLPFIDTEESITLPYSINATVLTHFFSPEKDQATLENAVIEFEGVYRPSQGVDFGFENKVFEVLSCTSGKVSSIKDDSLFGKSIEIDSDGLLLTYQSLSSVQVTVGQEVTQGSTIGLAGENIYSQNLGIHLHLVAEKDGKLLDPMELFGLKLSEIE